MDMTALVRNANLWTDLGTIRQHRTTTKLRIHNSTYIAEPTSKWYISLPGSQRYRNLTEDASRSAHSVNLFRD